MEYWILLILSTFMCFIIQVTGVSFTFSESKVIKGTGDIVLTCGVDETNILSVLVMQIKIFLGKESVQLGMVQAGKNVTNTEPAGLADRMRISGSIDANEPRKSQLILTINKDKILCTDGTLYECYLAYATSSVTNPEIKTDATNGTLEVYAYPSIMSLRGKRNGVDVEGSTVVNQARFKVGDELELICDANIGSIPNTDIQWKRTSEISSEDMWLDYSPPPGTSSQTAATYEDCKYTRTGRIMYKMTLADANRKSNLGFLCYVRVTGPPYNQYETTENPKFYAEVAGGNSGSQEAVASAVSGIFAIFTRQRVIRGTEGQTSLSCVINTTDIKQILNLQVKHWSGQRWIVFGSLLSDGFDATVDLGELANRVTVEGSLQKTSGQLTTTFNIAELQCRDGTAYLCEMNYMTTSYVANVVNSTGNLEVFEYPEVTELKGKSNGLDIEVSSIDTKASMKVGDELQLTCSANIGSINTTRIRWRKTTEIGKQDFWNEYDPPSSTVVEEDPEQQQCHYTRKTTITYSLTAADANTQNKLAFECYVIVSESPYNNYVTQSNKRFYVEVWEPKTAVTKAETQTEKNVGIPVGVSVAGILIVGIVVTFIVILKRKGVLFEKKTTSTQVEISSGGTEPHYYNETQNERNGYSGLKTGVSDEHIYTVIGPQASMPTNTLEDIHSVNVTNKSSVYSALQRSGTENHAYQIIE